MVGSLPSSPKVTPPTPKPKAIDEIPGAGLALELLLLLPFFFGLLTVNVLIGLGLVGGLFGEGILDGDYVHPPNLRWFPIQTQNHIRASLTRWLHYHPEPLPTAEHGGINRNVHWEPFCGQLSAPTF